MSQPKDTFYKQPNKGRNNRRGGQAKRQTNTGGSRNLDAKDPSSQKGQASYVPKSATNPVVQPTPGAAVPAAPRPAQPPSGHFPFPNGVPRGLSGQVVPPRVQSAPPSLSEQQQSPIFYPTKTFNPPNSVPHPLGSNVHAPAHATQPSTAAPNGTSLSPGQPQPTVQVQQTPSTPPQSQQPQPSQTLQSSVPQGQPLAPQPSQSQPQTQPQSQLQPQTQPQGQPAAQAQPPLQQPQSSQSQPQPQSPLQQGYKSTPYYAPYGYGYPAPGVPQYQMGAMPMQQPQPQPQPRGMGNLSGYQIPPQTRHGGLSHPVSQSLPHGVPLSGPLGAQPVPITPTHAPMGAPLVGHVPSGLPAMSRPTMQYPRPPYPSATSPGRPGQAPVHHTATVGHSVPVAVPSRQPRQSRKIAIVNPLTGREVTNSPPKESTLAKPPTNGPAEEGHVSETSTVVPDFQPPSPAKPIIIQAPPPGMQRPPYARRTEQTSPSTEHQPALQAVSPAETEIKPSGGVDEVKAPSPSSDMEAQQVKELAEPEPKDVQQKAQETKEKEEKEKEKGEEERQREEVERREREQQRREKEKKENQEKEEQERREKENQDKENQEREKEEKEKQETKKQEQEELERKRLSEAVSSATSHKTPEGEPEPSTPPKEASEQANEAVSEQVIEPKEAKVENAEKKNEEIKKHKPSRKEILKKADAGDFEAAHFDPYSSPDSRAHDTVKIKESTAPSIKENAEPKEAPKSSPSAGTTAEAEDDWEANADADWEAKAEDELVLQKDNKDISLRPNFGSTSTFRSTLAPAKPSDSSWSPHNTSGKKMYERDFLLKFQPYCREKPSGLPPIEVILGYDDKKGAGPKAKGQAAQPSWLRGAGSAPFSPRGGRGAPAGRFTTSFRGQRGVSTPRGGGRGGRGGLSKKGAKEDQAIAVEPLPSSDKMWVRPSRRQATDPHAEVYGKIRNILNKLTADKFSQLSKQLVDLMKEEVKDTDILKGVINIIFQKALLEPGFCTMYAELCRVLERSCPPFETDKPEGKPQSFKRFLLNKCQEEFEQKPAEDNKDTEVADPKLKVEQDAKRKDRMIGNIIFIGELYKEKMLTDKIVHDCVFRRLLGDIKNPAEEDIEALCKLMTTIGKVLDTPKAKGYMDAYFKRMKALSENQKIPSRIRFLLADVIDLRKRGWDEKKAVDPRTARAAAKPTAIATRRPAATPPTTPPVRGGSERTRPPSSSAPGGWETVGPKSRHDPSLKSQQPMVLGPNSQTSGPMGSGGAKGWRDGPEKSQPKRTEPGSSSRNMFSALAQDRSPSADRKPVDERDDEYARSSRDTGRSPRERGPTRGTKEDDFEEPTVKSGGTWKEVEESSRILLLEYLDSHDTEEALECFRELSAPQLHSSIIKLALVQALDLKEPERQLYAKLFKALFDEEVVTDEQFEQGFKAVFDDFENIMEDAPRAPLVIGSFVGNGVLDGYLKLSGLRQSVDALISSNIAEKILAAAFARVVESAGVEELRELYKSSNANVMDYFRSANRTEEYLGQWLSKYKLPSLSPTRDYAPTLQKMIQEGEDVDSISAWIEANVASDVWTDGDASFATALCRFILDYIASKTVLAAGSFESEEKMLAEERRLLDLYGPLLSKFVSSYTDTQLRCLFTVQQFCFDNQFPKGLMERIFHQFYMQEVILEEVYRTWAADTGATVPGKQQALAEVDAWLKWLDNAQKEEGDETEARDD